MTDIHSHILFDIDDGADTIEESVSMLKTAESQGIRNVFCTSHSWAYDITTYNKNFDMLNARLQQENINIRLYKGSELFFSDIEINIASYLKTVNTLNATDYLLLEFPTDITYDEIYACISKIRNNAKIIIAHIERYQNLADADDDIRQLRNEGCLFQVNAYSFENEKNISIKKFARKLLDKQYVDFIGSDAHSLNHRPYNMSEGINYIYTHCDKEYADMICFKNAENLLIKRS